MLVVLVMHVHMLVLERLVMVCVQVTLAGEQPRAACHQRHRRGAEQPGPVAEQRNGPEGTH